MKLVKAALLGGAIALLCSSANAEDGTVPIRKLTAIKTAMRDGVKLVSDVWLPEAAGKYPVILMRSPYRMRTGRMSGSIIKQAEYFAAHGYAVVVQDARGTGDSEGEFNFLPQEPKDGYDSIESLAVEPWANGRLCMMGYSYLGAVQWLAAKEMPPHLTCMAPTASSGQILDEVPAIGGVFMHQFALNWVRMVTTPEAPRGSEPKIDWNTVLMQRPLLTLDEALGGKMRLYREWQEHDTLDAYWRPAHLTTEEIARVKIPVMETTGWFDGDQPGAMFFWKGIESNPTHTPDQYLVVGPWSHSETFNGGHEKQGLIKLPKSSIIDNKAMHLAFFDHYLKQTGPKPNWARVHVFVTGADEWRDYDSFPPAQAKPRALYFSGNGKANSLNGDGTLTWDKPAKQPPDKFTFDPKHPVGMDWGNAFGSDRTEQQKRPDMLVYTSQPLTEPVEIIGNVSVELYAASDARDTDFTAAICDIGPDGKAIALGSRPIGIIRARYRNGPESKPSLLTPGKVERYSINLAAIGHRFLPGHRIRVEVSSSAYPNFATNQNTGNPIATDTEWKIAHQSVFHDGGRPSAVLLPVVAN